MENEARRLSDAQIRALMRGAQNIVNLGKALDSPLRLAILAQLAKKEYTVAGLARVLETSVSLVGQNVNVLKRCGIIFDRPSEFDRRIKYLFVTDEIPAVNTILEHAECLVNQ